MPVPTFALRASFTGNGVADTFAFSFRFLEDAHLRVTTRDAYEVVDELTLYSDYTVSGAGRYSGGSITLIAGPLASGLTLWIERIVEPVQTAALEAQAAVFPETVTLIADRLAMGLQQLDDVLGVYDPDRVRVPKLRAVDVDGSGRYDARGNRLGNLTDPALPQDAATMVWTLTFVNAVATNILALVGSGGGGGIGILEYLLANRPAAELATKNQIIVIKDPGQPAVTQMCMERSDGSYEWVTLASASPV